MNFTHTHTPGPWAEGKPFSDGRQMVTPIYAADLQSLARGQGAGKWLIAWLHHNAVSSAQRKANARLIAAAPVLLETLVHINIALEAWERLPVQKAKALRKEIDAAIAKAARSTS